MTKIKVTKKKLNLDTRIRKSRSPRKKFEDTGRPKKNVTLLQQLIFYFRLKLIVLLPIDRVH